MARELSGGKVLAITLAAFGVIIGVNALLAFKAVQTFPGLEVPNSYVASQVFDAERKAQEKLGWTLAHRYDGGELVLSFRDAAGLPVQPREVSALIGRTTEAAEDMRPAFAYRGGDFVAPVTLGKGAWMIMLEARADDGTRFHQRLDLFVKG